MLRERLTAELKSALKAKDEIRVSTLRLILAALKDRDIAARGDSRPAGISDDEILLLLQTMVRQRRESIELYERGGRDELAAKEREEIAIIESFLPQPLSEDEVRDASARVMTEIGAKGLKDMGRIMAELKTHYPGQLDFARTSGIVKEMLSKA